MNFEDFRLSRETIKSISEIGFEEPTPIQVSAIPLILGGRDIVGQAQTGTGKTAAFGIPIVEKCQKGRKPFAIVLEPTRELAVQVSQEIYKIGKYQKIKVLPVYGGASIGRQIKTLERGVNVVVGTPGRVIDLLRRKTLSLSEVGIVVLDEADEMLDMGFIDDMETILKTTPAERQTLLFSATMPQQIMNIASRHMRNPEKLRVNTKDIVIPKIRQMFYEVGRENRINALSRLLDVEDPQLAIVFCHTKREVDDIQMKLRQLGYDAGAIHGDYTQSKRDEVMNKFKAGALDILVATDVAARGLDIKNVTHVINYGIPQNPGSYIHRIGRTGRAGKSGIAITLITPREYKHLRLIERTAKTIIDRKKMPSRAEVVRAREKNIVKDIARIIKENQHEGYFQMVTELANDYGLDHIAAAGLCAAFGDTKDKLRTDVNSQNDNFGTMVTAKRNDTSKAVLKSATSKRQKGSHRNWKNQYKCSNNAYKKRNREPAHPCRSY
jgi:ATP-dependent RNA helicase DeaD